VAIIDGLRDSYLIFGYLSSFSYYLLAVDISQV